MNLHQTQVLKYKPINSPLTGECGLSLGFGDKVAKQATTGAVKNISPVEFVCFEFSGTLAKYFPKEERVGPVLPVRNRAIYRLGYLLSTIKSVRVLNFTI